MRPLDYQRNSVLVSCADCRPALYMPNSYPSPSPSAPILRVPFSMP